MKRSLFFRFIFILTTASAGHPIAAAQQKRPNILFIAIDDLRPDLGAYGNRMVKTPNIDRLAAFGTVFMANYCQQAVCGPTRASLMTGMRPDYTKVWDLKTTMRSMNPDILSLPQHLIAQGYSTQGIGKVYDPRCVDKDLDKPSWSVPYHKTKEKYYAKGFSEPVSGRYQSAETRLLAAQYEKEAADKGMSKAEINDYVQAKVKPSVESADVPDNAYNDGANVEQAKNILADLGKSGQPFFFAVGLAKPHLPFVAPKKYWDLYRRDAMPLAAFREMPAQGVDIAMHTSGELRGYSDIAPLIDPSKEKGYGITLPDDKQRELIHGYHAAISYTDANVGRLLDALDSLGLRENTIVVLWGDHGWHFGDHNLWCKHSNFEQATRAPLIISAPGMKAAKTRSPSEFVDVFPTLCDLASVPVPAHLHGKSLVPVMKDPRAKVKHYSVSQYPRPSSGKEGNVMGYSIRTEQFRYTIWMNKGFRSDRPFDPSLVVGKELYDYAKDPEERRNLEADKSYQKTTADMHGMMLDYLKSQESNGK